MKNKMQWFLCTVMAVAAVMTFGTADVTAAPLNELTESPSTVTPLAVVPSYSQNFVDVPVGSWYYDDVSYVCDMGLMNGVGNNRFNPHGTATRAMMATILHRCSGSQEPVDRYSYFWDLDTENGWWYIDAVLWAEDYGIVQGTDEDSFSPNQAVTREQLVTILYRYLQNYLDKRPEYNSFELYGYADKDNVSDYAETAMCWAVTNGIVEGQRGDDFGMYLNPRHSATRAQIAAIVARFCDLVEGRYL